MGQFFKAAKAADVASGKLQSVELAGKRIALFSLGGEIYAIGDLCTPSATNVAGRLAEAMLENPSSNSSSQSPLNSSRFDFDSGSVTGHLSTVTVERYNVCVNGDDIEIEI
jgi:nitrite reductase/ring-hydroxylating ferredoxin subunit